MKLRAQKHANYVCFHKLILGTSNMAERAKHYVHFRCWAGLSAHTRKKTKCALVERIYLIIVSREGNHARFEWLSKIFESFIQCDGKYPPSLQSVYGHAKKVSYNLCMNRASLDRELLDCVSRTSTTHLYSDVLWILNSCFDFDF